MRSSAIYRKWSFIPAVLALVLIVQAQTPNQPQVRAIKTPLKQETLTLLANELSGQRAFNNVVTLAGAPWIRDRQEFSGTLYEAQQIYDFAKKPIRPRASNGTRVLRFSITRSMRSFGCSSRSGGGWQLWQPMPPWLPAARRPPI